MAGLDFLDHLQIYTKPEFENPGASFSSLLPVKEEENKHLEDRK